MASSSTRRRRGGRSAGIRTRCAARRSSTSSTTTTRAAARRPSARCSPAGRAAPSPAARPPPLAPDELPGRRALRGETTEQVVCYRIRATNEERWSLVRANPVYDANGVAVLSVSVIRDITATKAAEQRLRFLARASELLNETLDYEQTLAAIAEMAVPTLAGQVVIDLLEADCSIR